MVTIKAKDLVLTRLTKALPDSLKLYAENFRGLSFGNPADFQLTPLKPYTARADVPVNYEGTPVATLVAIAFLPNDGTGDESLYRLDDLNIPMIYQGKGTAVLPRSKSGVVVEAFLPLFSAEKSGKIHPLLTSLDEIVALGLRGSSARPGIFFEKSLGVDSRNYRRFLAENFEPSPAFDLTVGTSSDKRFCDPHSIYNSIEADVAQVGGFLTIKDHTNPLATMLYAWAAQSSVRQQEKKLTLAQGCAVAYSS